MLELKVEKISVVNRGAVVFWFFFLIIIIFDKSVFLLESQNHRMV